MCISPVYMPELGISRSCHKCWQCYATKANHWVGSSIAEAKSAGQAHFVTLSYGGDAYMYGEAHKNPRAQRYYYEDVQRYLKRLRNNGAAGRFFFCGQHGPQNGRVHWHGLLFWKGDPPPNLVTNERYVHWIETAEQAEANGSRYSQGKELWPDGWTFWEGLDVNMVGSIEYVLRYVIRDLQKGLGEHGIGGRKFYGMSCKPPLGAEWFRAHARQYVEQELAPQDLFYAFGDVFKMRYRWTQNGYMQRPERRRFLMRGGAVRHYLDEFVQQWRLMHGSRPWPFSELVDEHVEDMERRQRRLLGITDFSDEEMQLSVRKPDLRLIA